MNSAQAPDAVVVGAGVVGAACAAALASSGMRVLVLEAGIPGGGTTAAAMGHLVVMDDSPAQLELTRLGVTLWHEHAAAGLSPNVEFEPRGTIWVAEDDAQLDALEAKRELYAANAVAADRLDATQLSREEPQLRVGLAGGLLVPGDAVLYPPTAALHLLAIAERHGATVRRGTRVTEIQPHGVRLGTETISAGTVVNAAGAHAAALTPGLPIVPRKGHLAITERYPGFVNHQLVELGYLASAHGMSSESVAFNVQPRSTGQVLIGSSRELVGWDASSNRNMLKRMLERAQSFMPGLAGTQVIRTWTGFRPATPDSLPLIGAWEATPGLWIAAGHEGLGITTALATAAIIAAGVTGGTPPIDAAPFNPSREIAAHAAEMA